MSVYETKPLRDADPPDEVTKEISRPQFSHDEVQRATQVAAVPAPEANAPTIVATRQGEETSPAAEEKAPAVCPSCGETFRGEFCHACGEQQSAIGDLSWRKVATRAAHELFSWDGRTLVTLRRLLFSPGALPLAYVAGRRRSLTKPFKLCFLIFAVNLFVFSLYAPASLFDFGAMIDADQSGGLGRAATQLAANTGQTRRELVRAVTSDWQTLRSLLQPLTVLFVALPLTFAYRRQNRFFAEHLVFAAHTVSFYVLLGIILFPAYVVTGLAASAGSVAVGLVSAVISLLYIIIAVRRFYRESIGWSLLKATIVYVIYVGCAVAIHVTAFALALLKATVWPS